MWIAEGRERTFWWCRRVVAESGVRSFLALPLGGNSLSFKKKLLIDFRERGEGREGGREILCQDKFSLPGQPKRGEVAKTLLCTGGRIFSSE